ncbi:MAG TPA: tautomerase family protein [Stellaceae bacterium]|nr:tautomerase family protein [Stellaceae bacterium]
MPIAKIYVPADLLTPEQRRDIIEGVARVINTVEHRAPDAATYVLINEVPSRGWGFKGRPYRP